MTSTLLEKTENFQLQKFFLKNSKCYVHLSQAEINEWKNKKFFRKTQNKFFKFFNKNFKCLNKFFEKKFKISLKKKKIWKILRKFKFKA